MPIKTSTNPTTIDQNLADRNRRAANLLEALSYYQQRALGRAYWLAARKARFCSNGASSQKHRIAAYEKTSLALRHSDCAKAVHLTNALLVDEASPPFEAA